MRTSMNITAAVLLPLAAATVAKVASAAPPASSASSDRPAAAPEGQALADAYVECWKHLGADRWDDFGRCYSPTAHSIFAGFPTVKGSKAILEQHARPFKAAFPDLAGEQQLILVQGSRLAGVSLVRGTHRGALAGPGGTLPPTGKSIGQLVAHVVLAGPGAAVQKEWFIQDMPTMFAQLGVSAAPARPARKSLAAPAQVVIATGSDTEKANLAAARKLYSAFNRHDPSVLTAFAEDIVDYNQSLPADLVGKKAVSELLTQFWTMSSKGKIVKSAELAAGDYVVLVGTFEGVNDGDMPAIGLKKTGKRMKLDLIEVTRWQDGKVKEIWPFFNGTQLAAQLGLLPPPTKTAQR